MTGFEIDRLKAMAYRSGANGIGNILIKNKYNPIGYADAYKCANDKFQNLQIAQKRKNLNNLVVVEDE